uniref:F-box protein 6 n=1 Tax=Macaca mulatta TaxID=9544 RepID=A0A5F8A3M8_MACMU
MDAPHPKAALDSINELPENILLELFTHVPARQLLLNCRLVCSLWRDLIDLMTLWKRKCLREGFITEDWDQPVADWKIFYFLRSLHRNLLRNPCAEEDMFAWQIDFNGGDRWKVESLPGAHGTDFPDPKVKKYFVTSYEMCLKSQLVDLVAEGYWEELLDTFRPDIVVKDWFAARADCGCTYQLKVQLTSADYFVLASFEPPPVTIQQWNNAAWTEVRPHPLALSTHSSQGQDGKKQGAASGPKVPLLSGLELLPSRLGSSLRGPGSCLPLPSPGGHFLSPPPGRSPTPSQTTPGVSATSSFSTGAVTPSTGQAGMGPESPTAASSSATRGPGTRPPPRLSLGRSMDRRRLPNRPTKLFSRFSDSCPYCIRVSQRFLHAGAEHGVGSEVPVPATPAPVQPYQLVETYCHIALTFCFNKCFQAGHGGSCL